MLLAVGLICMIGLSSQTTIEHKSIKEFIEDSKTIQNAIIFLTDQKFKSSKTFVDKTMLELSEALATTYSGYKQYAVDKRQTGGLKGDPLFDSFYITEYPSVLVFINGVPIAIEQSVKLDHIKDRIDKGLQNYPIEIKTIKGVKKLETDRLTVFYKSQEESFKNLLKGLSAKFTKVQFVELPFSELCKQVADLYKFELQGIDGTILFSRRAGDLKIRQHTPLTDLSLKSITKFITKSARATVSFFDKESLKEMDTFSRGIILANVDPLVNSKLMGMITDVVEKDYNKVFGYFIEPNNQEGVEFLRSVGLPTSFPQVSIIKKRYDGKFNKFVYRKLTDNTTLADLREFADDCIDNMYPRVFQSEEAPTEDLYHYMHTLVGKTIDEKVFKEKEHYHIVFLYNKNTAGALPKFQKLAEKFRHEKVKFYIFDADKNESKHIEIPHEGKIMVFKNHPRIKKTFYVDKSLSLAQMGVFLEKVLKKDQELLEYVRKADYWQDL